MKLEHNGSRSIATEHFASRDWWQPDGHAKLCRSQDEILDAVTRVREAVRLVRDGDGAIVPALDGDIYAARAERVENDLPLVGILSPLYPEWLGDRSFAESHGCRFPYVVGEMARGIATTDVEMLDLDMEIEAGLGIDSIKQVEILSAVQERIPGLREIEPVRLAELKTLGEIVGFVENSGAGTPAMPAADNGPARPAPSRPKAEAARTLPWRTA